MGLPRFLDISSGILQENTLHVQFGGDTAFSFPCLTVAGEELMDVLFLYNDKEAEFGPRPFGWLMLHAATGKTALLANCGARDFIDPEVFPLGGPVALRPRQSLPEGERARLYREIFEVYEELRLFAFEPEPADWQQAAMERYAWLFLTLAPAGHDPFYKALAPDFFRWLGLLEEVPLCVPGAGQPPPAQPPHNEGLDRVLDSLEALTGTLARLPGRQEGGESQALLEALEALSRKFDDRAAADEAREALIGQLHGELQEYKNQLLEKLTLTMERDIIKVIDDIGRTIRAYRGKQPTRDNYNRFFSLLEGVETDLGDILYRQGIEPYRVEGTGVDTQRQQILGTVPTDNASEDKTVAQRHSEGWQRDGRVIRPERISVYLYSGQSEVRGE